MPASENSCAQDGEDRKMRKCHRSLPYDGHPKASRSSACRLGPSTDLRPMSVNDVPHTMYVQWWWRWVARDRPATGATATGRVEETTLGGPEKALARAQH